MEDFHVRHLSDAQMRELNPLIRNALAMALYAWQQQAQPHVAWRYVENHLRMIPPYLGAAGITNHVSGTVF
jgi:uncharacterized membrane protein YsdA (DUF1294 family)